MRGWQKRHAGNLLNIGLVWRCDDFGASPDDHPERIAIEVILRRVIVLIPVCASGPYESSKNRG